MLRAVSEFPDFRPGVYGLASEEPADVRSGVALSGANGDATGELALPYSGIMTAAEIAGLDLEGTQLAVVSACESGLGVPTLGEGLEGLRTALRIAGAKTRLLTLWKISDCATTAFMDEWYRRIAAGEDRVVALRAVKLDALAGRLKSPQKCAPRGVSFADSVEASTEWSNPYFWAPFIADGAAGPL
jgi:CHAT domain-containing protein